MNERKDLRSRIDAEDKRIGKRILDRLGRGINETINGWWYRLIAGNGDTEAAAADYYRSKADVAALERREERLEERVDQLEAELNEVREEREEAEERLKAAADTVAQEAAAAHSCEVDDDHEPELEVAAYDLLVDVAHNDLGERGVTAGYEPVQRAAVRAGVDPDEVVEEMRRLAEPIMDCERLSYVDDPLERGFLLSDQGRQSRVESGEFDRIRRAIADEVLADEDIDREKVPERDIDVDF